jgi:spermidine/putrescine transport system ATP-binding protein
LNTAVAPAPAPDLEVRALTKRFAAHVAVNELSFSVARGSFFSILGPSGCGKTTLLRMIAGFIQPDGGAITIGGRDMARVPPNRRPVNMVFQHLALFPMMSVGENVAFGLARRGVARAERTRRAAAMLERVGLAGAAGKRTDELSGGQRQRVAVARALVNSPSIVLADEPTGNRDSKTGDEIMALFARLHGEGNTIIVVTHENDVAQRAHRIIHVRDGKVETDELVLHR